ncbi:MAG TPA: hypothetical protein VHC19_23615 [Pirellulales bacterium]|jgi:hypothetical protein|nr:hypothetical protein [Pirellulales bacterium]
MKPQTWLLVALTLVAVPAARVDAAPPWEKIAIFQRIEADPDELYPIAENHGPWIIMCASFAGDEAEDQARELVHELRTRYKLRAYTHEVDFDFAKDDKNRGANQYHQRRRRYRVEKMKEIAVMVGDFSAVDDPQAQKTLNKLRTAQPDCLDTEKRLKEGKGEYRTLANLRRMQQEVHRLVGLKQEPRGPMGHAFITTNPLLPDDYFVPKGLDPVVLEMNEPVKHSLLNCPGKYSCKVATFTGAVLIDQNLIEEVEKKGKKLPSRLEEAAIKAHELTMALRAKGYEAYEFHDRYASMVTVGSFNAVGTPRADGQIELDPRLHALMETFSAEKSFQPGQASPKVGAPKTLVGIPFDVQAVPVEVPQRPISRSYDRPLFSAN